MSAYFAAELNANGYKYECVDLTEDSILDEGKVLRLTYNPNELGDYGNYRKIREALSQYGENVDTVSFDGCIGTVYDADSWEMASNLAWDRVASSKYKGQMDLAQEIGEALIKEKNWKNVFDKIEDVQKTYETVYFNNSPVSFSDIVLAGMEEKRLHDYNVNEDFYDDDGSNDGNKARYLRNFSGEMNVLVEHGFVKISRLEDTLRLFHAEPIVEMFKSRNPNGAVLTGESGLIFEKQKGEERDAYDFGEALKLAESTKLKSHEKVALKAMLCDALYAYATENKSAKDIYTEYTVGIPGKCVDFDYKVGDHFEKIAGKTLLGRDVKREHEASVGKDKPRAVDLTPEFSQTSSGKGVEK